MKLVNETLAEFKEKFGIQDGDSKCINCGKPTIYNKFWYSNGYAYARYEHECPEEYWVTYCIPLGKKQDELRNYFEQAMEE